MKIDFILDFMRELGNNLHPNAIFNRFFVVYTVKSFDSLTQKISENHWQDKVPK